MKLGSIKSYFKRYGFLSNRYLYKLKEYLNIKECQKEAIDLAEDCDAIELIDDIAKLHKHENEDIREEVMACLLGYMRLSEYALLAVERYEEKEKDFGVKARILFNLGYIINDIENKELKKRVAKIIIEGIEKKDEETGYEYRTEAYHSMMVALNVPIEEQADFIEDIRKEDIDPNIIKKFKQHFINNDNNTDMDIINTISSLIFNDIKNSLEDIRIYLYRKKIESYNIISFRNKKFSKDSIERTESTLKYGKQALEGLIGIYKNLMSLREIDEYYLKNGSLNEEAIQDLSYHILYDEKPGSSISLAAYCNMTELASDIATLHKHKDEYVREEVMACLLGYMRLSEYALLAVERYEEKEKDFGVKTRILFNLGYIINDIKNKKLKKKVAKIIIEGIEKRDEETGYEYRGEAYHSMMVALNVPIEEQPDFIEDIKKEDIDPNIIKNFKQHFVDYV